MQLSNKKHWDNLRKTRDKMLQESDKYMLPDFPVDTKTRGLYKEYRQYLRDCPILFDDTIIPFAKIKSFEAWIEWKRRGNHY
jgi:hypothetical protein